MDFQLQEIQSKAVRLSLLDDSDTEVGHAYLFLITNDLHDQPYALLEDVFIEEAYRGKGLGKKLVQQAIQAARDASCYKIIGTSRMSREKVHAFYTQ